MTITDTEAGELLRLARSMLAYLAGEEVDRQRVSGPGEVTVNVTVYVGRRLKASMSGQGDTLDEAVRDAATRAAGDSRFGPPLSPEDLPDARVELWVQTGCEDIDDADDVNAKVDVGFHGLSLSGYGRFAYYKPSVALTKGQPRPDLLFDKLAKKARLSPGAWRDPEAILQRTVWEHYSEFPSGPDRVLHLRRLRPVNLEELTAVSLRERARLAADRLLAVQASDDGYYLYRFHPFTNAAEHGPGNLVRQAGCAYALAQSADDATDAHRRDLLAASARRVIDTLLGRIVERDGMLFIAELPKPGVAVRGKLGTVALTLATLQRPSVSPGYQVERRRLVEAILSAQRPDGSFRCRSDSTSVADDGTSQDFFPGEALVALAVESTAGSLEARDAMTRALPWYRARFRSLPTTAFVPWQVDAWRRCAQRPDGDDEAGGPQTEVCHQFVFEMADWLLPLQIRSPASHPDLVGGFAAPGRRPNFSTATYTEAIIRAFAMAQQAGDGDRAARYRAASLLGLDFVRRLQIVPDTAVLFPDPARAVGGTTASLSDMTIRCDSDQHTLTCCLAALETPELFIR